MKKCSLDFTPAFAVFLCAYYYFDPAHTFAPFLAAVTLHEAGHLFVLWLLRVRVHKLRLAVSGAVIETDLLPYRREIAVAMAGPALNAAALSFFAIRAPLFALVNFCLLAYNLLPFYPLDGGRILRALLHLLLSDRVARALERGIAAVCLSLLIAFSCYLTCVWHAGLWPVLVCGFLLMRVSGTILPEKNTYRELTKGKIRANIPNLTANRSRKARKPLGHKGLRVFDNVSRM